MQHSEIVEHSGSYGSLMDLGRMFNEAGLGENLQSMGVSAESMFTKWMNSPGHRANILNPDYRRIGIGFAEDRGVTLGTSQKYSDYDKVAYKIQFNEVTNLYHVSTMTYWAAQHFGF